MSYSTIALLLAVATSTEANLLKQNLTVLAVATSTEANLLRQNLTLGSLLKQSTYSNGRHLQVVTSAECQEACPKGMDFLETISSDGASVRQDPKKALEVFCPHEPTASCVGSTPACQDEATIKLGVAGFSGCMCDCPSMAEGIGLMEDPPTTLQCTFLNCATGSTKCKASYGVFFEQDPSWKKAIKTCASRPETSASVQVTPIALLVLSVSALFA